MTAGPTHEDPLLVLLPPGTDPGAEIRAFLEHPLVGHFVLPPMWALDRADVDLPDALPQVPTVTADNLSEVLDTLTRICDEAALDRLVQATWRRVDEMVRDFYLKRSTLQTFAAIFKLSAKSIDREPPAQFRTDRIHDHGFETQYRLADRGDLEGSFLAPPEEGSLVYYPFDPENAGARRSWPRTTS